MTIFKSYKMKWWQLVMLKWTAFLIGIAIGSLWPEIFAPYSTVLIVIGLVMGAYLTVMWVSGSF